MRNIVFELCAESISACMAAKEGGAHRIELCCALSEDGLTPSYALIRNAIDRSGLPVYVLLRPRGGDFLYSDDEFALMREDLVQARKMGAAGFALGVLQPDGTVDVNRTSALVRLAGPLEVTFHRAFDVSADLPQALEDVILTGCRRVLTSGGAETVFDGAAMLARLQNQAAGRIVIAAGGGLRQEGASILATQTGLSNFHGSARYRALETHRGAPPKAQGTPRGVLTHASTIRALVSALRADAHNDL